MLAYTLKITTVFIVCNAFNKRLFDPDELSSQTSLSKSFSNVSNYITFFSSKLLQIVVVAKRRQLAAPDDVFALP